VRYDLIGRAPPACRHIVIQLLSQCAIRIWSIHQEHGAPVVGVLFSGPRLRLRLKSGFRYHRQLDSIAKIVAGEAVRGELTIYQRGNDLMCKIVGWLPRPNFQEHRRGVLTVRTSNHALIVAFNASCERIWT
jgi:hypothetical protein